MNGLLEGKAITRHFGGVRALTEVDITVSEAELFAIIGPNGAGKTTLLNILSGLDHPDAGNVYFKGQEITGAAPWDNAGRGLARTLQTAVVFPRMTVLDNIMIGHVARHKLSFMGALLWLPLVRRWQQDAYDKAEVIAGKLGLAEHAHREADTLPLGLQRLVEIGRALATEPELLLLDEPAAGLAKEEVTRLGEVLRTTADDGIAVCLVEHNMTLVMNVAERILVIRQGQRLTEGTPEQIRNDPQVIEAYLGSQSREGPNRVRS